MWAWVLNSAGDIEVRRRSRARRPHCKATTWRHLFKCFNALPAIFSLPAQFRAVAGNLLRLRFAIASSVWPPPTLLGRVLINRHPNAGLDALPNVRWGVKRTRRGLINMSAYLWAVSTTRHDC